MDAAHAARMQRSRQNLRRGAYAEEQSRAALPADGGRSRAERSVGFEALLRWQHPTARCSVTGQSSFPLAEGQA